MAEEEEPAKDGRKRRSARSPKKRVRPARSVQAAAQGAPWTFPKHTLEKAIEVAQALEEMNAGKPLKAADLAPLLGL
jgi:hypothetical protein